MSDSAEERTEQSPERTENDRLSLPDPPPNPKGGRTLVVDNTHPAEYTRPSAALKEAGPDDQVFVKPGMYEDTIFVARHPIRLVGAGKDHVQIFSRRGGPFYLQQVPDGLVSGITFRYIGSDQHSPMNLLDSTCTITGCRVMDGVLSGIVIYGPESKPSCVDNEVCNNRETGIFIFAGARPYIARNRSHHNHHFGIAVRDDGSRPDLVRNLCHDNMLSGLLIFHLAQAMVLGNQCYENYDWGLVMTPDCSTTPAADELIQSNELGQNPRGALHITQEPLAQIGR